ncbi:MAG TPA: hypothetical protein VG410_13355 [Solirubrobacteraceae bacterium]|nr:hypothetical protein [Solirubrobacteraceae bacterium]
MSESLAELLRDRDVDALAGFYDARAGYVEAYCRALCGPEQIDEATLSAFLEFLARASGTRADDELDLLLVKAARGAAAARMSIDSTAPECRAMPEVLAARANGEDVRGEQAFAAHLDGCETCRETTTRLLDAEQALKSDPRSEPSQSVRERVLELAGNGDPA